MSTESNLSNNIGGASKSVPQTPKDFLKLYGGKRVKLRAAGIFNDITYDRECVAYAMERYEYVEGKYRVKVDFYGGLSLHYPHHIVDVVKLKWVEVNGQRVEASEIEE
jgi:hypothetical protein